MLIAFSGIDCSGKSTQIAKLAEAMGEQGRPVCVLWHRPGYSPLLDAARKVVRRLRPGALPTTASPAARARAFASTRVRRTWASVALVDSLVHLALSVRWHRLMGRAVICDRYVEDALLDLRLRFPELGTDQWRLAGLLRALAPRPDVRILLRISHGEMLRRMEVKAEPFPDAPETRDQRFAAYLEFVKRGYQAVDGARPVDVVHGDILKLVTARRASP